MKNEFQEIPLRQGLVDLARGEVRYRNGARCELSEREAELLRYLASHAGRVVSRDELLARVWGLDPQRTITRTIDMHIALLRGKLRDKGEKPRLLLTVHGQGYMFSRSPAAQNGRSTVAGLVGQRVLSVLNAADFGTGGTHCPAEPSRLRANGN